MRMIHNTEQSPQAEKQQLKKPSFFRKNRILWRVLTSITAFFLIIDWSGKARITTNYYEIEDARIQNDLKIAIISDLHNALYGENQSQLFNALNAAAPDAVLLLGDIFDQYGENENSFALLQKLSEVYTCYFVYGNHEYKSGKISEINAALEAANITILCGSSVVLQVGQTKVQVFGIDDALGGKKEQLQQISDAANARSDELYSILAIHVPNDVESYLQYDFDLMLSGHTHGGQVILPGLINGLYAPGQGLFPKYGGGQYHFDNQTLIICRGLARTPLWLPRVLNPPELCVVTLKPIS